MRRNGRIIMAKRIVFPIGKDNFSVSNKKMG
jgi:hypothetical protein